MNWIQIAAMGACSSSVVITGIKFGSSINEKYNDLLCRINGAERSIRKYNDQFVLPKSEFLYKWNAPPGRDDDMEIIAWCLDHGVKFKYHRDTSSPHAYPKDSFEVWITEPRLAMEFKLRYHGT
jgi:hypothetical protein